MDFYSKNGWDLMGTTVDREKNTITYHLRKQLSLRTKDIMQPLSYYVRFENLPDFYFS